MVHGSATGGGGGAVGIERLAAMGDCHKWMGADVSLLSIDQDLEAKEESFDEVRRNWDQQLQVQDTSPPPYPLLLLPTYCGLTLKVASILRLPLASPKPNSNAPFQPE